MKEFRWLAAILALISLLLMNACFSGAGDKNDSDAATDDDHRPTVDDDNDGGADDDSRSHDDDQPPEPQEFLIFIIYGYPGEMERSTVDFFLKMNGFVRDQDRWTFEDIYGQRRFVVREGTTAESLLEALSTEEAYVIFAGHSNFGLGPTFAENWWNGSVENITGLQDFLNFGSAHVSIQYRYLVEHQAYPNLVIQPEQIADHPLNYYTDFLHLERFENIDGIRPGTAFPDPHGEGLDIYHYRAPGYEVGNLLDKFLYWLFGIDMHLENTMLIVNGGGDDLPELKYKALFYKSCNSDLYFLDNLNHGTVFYTNSTPSYFRPTIWIFLDGLIKGCSWETIKNAMNKLDDIYGYYVFDEAGASTGRSQAPPELDPQEKSMFIREMIGTFNDRTIKDWLALLEQPQFSMVWRGEVIDTGGEILAAQWALAEKGDVALTLLLEELDEAAPFYKANLLYALSEFEDPAAEEAIVQSLGDLRFTPGDLPFAFGLPLRICDVAYNIIARQLNDPRLYRPLAGTDTLRFRDEWIGELGWRHK